MVARLIPTARPCSAATWAELKQVVNALPASVVVKQEALDEVFEHHQRLGLRVSGLALAPSGTKYYSVNRLKLVAFMEAHGKVCKHD